MRSKLAVSGFALAGTLLIFSSILPSQTVNMGRTYVASQNVRYANEAGTGTTVNKLAKLTGAPSTAIITATTDTSGIIGIVVAGAGTTGSAAIAFKGKASCVFDSATTAGHYVKNDASTAGDCEDAGATYPTSGQVIGIVTSTNGGAGTYEVDLTLGQPQAGGSGGGSNTYGAVASLPGTCAVGNTYRTSDSLYTYLCTGVNTWTAFWRDRKVTPPPSAGWSWDNQGTATISSVHGYEYLKVNDNPGNVNQRMRYMNAPGTPYRIETILLHELSPLPPHASSGAQNCGFGIGFRDGTGKLLLLQLRWESGASNMYFYKWTNSTTFSGAYVAVTATQTFDALTKNPAFMAISDDGVDLTAEWSIDGLTWNVLYTVSRTDYFAAGPTQVGFSLYNSLAGVDMALLDWTVK